MELSKSNLIIVIGLIAFVAVLSLFLIKITGEQNQDLYSTVFICGKQKVPFRVNISSCNGVPVSPDEETLTNTLTSPFAEGVIILVNPNETGGTAVSAFEIYKVYNSLRNYTGKNIGIAYTEPWPNQPNIPVLSIENASFSAPIIWLRQNQSSTIIRVEGPKIFVDSKSQQDLDAAVCKISILTIKKVLDC